MSTTIVVHLRGEPVVKIETPDRAPMFYATDGALTVVTHGPEQDVFYLWPLSSVVEARMWQRK